MTPAPMTVRICHLYPRLFSVAGDRGNLFALMQRCAWRGIRYSVTEADVGVVPDFAQSDLILVHGGQDREMTAAALRPRGEGRPAAGGDRGRCRCPRRVRRLPAPGPVLRPCRRAADTGAGRAGRGHRGRPDSLHRACGGGVRSGLRRAAPAYRVREPQRAHLPGQRRQAARAGARRGWQQRGGRHRGRPLPGGVRHLPARAGAAQEPVAGRSPARPGRWRTATRTSARWPRSRIRSETQAHAAALRLARRPAGRWRAAVAGRVPDRAAIASAGDG